MRGARHGATGGAVGLALGVLVTAAPAARAQSTPAVSAPDQASTSAPDATAVAASREQFRAGMDAGRRGDWETARQRFERAQAMFPRPLTRLNLAAASARTHRLLAAAEHYREFLREATEGRPAEHRDEAASALAALTARSPHLRIDAPGLRALDVLALDGRTLAAVAVGTELPVDPGAHTATVTREGREIARANTEIAEGTVRTVTLTLPSEPAVAPTGSTASTRANAHPRPSARVLAPSPAPPPANRGGVLRSPWLWTAVGIVAVGAAAAVTWAAIPHGGFQGDLQPGTVTAR